MLVTSAAKMGTEKEKKDKNTGQGVDPRSREGRIALAKNGDSTV